MAATKLIAMHQNKGRSIMQCLKDRTDYAKNGEKTENSREPVVDVTPLKNGSSKNATHKTVKTPLTVEQGDIVLYTNEYVCKR